MVPARALAVLLACVLHACSPASEPVYHGTDIRSQRFEPRLDLVDHLGVRRTLDDFRGKLVVIFFGYTHCPDVCPTTLADTATALAALTPQEAARIQVLFVTVDPERDTAEMLRQYVPYFDTTFLGLRGKPVEVAAAARTFRVVYRVHRRGANAGYTIDHTAGSFVLDATGQARLFLPFGMPATEMSADLRRLLREAG